MPKSFKSKKKTTSTASAAKEANIPTWLPPPEALGERVKASLLILLEF